MQAETGGIDGGIAIAVNAALVAVCRRLAPLSSVVAVDARSGARRASPTYGSVRTSSTQPAAWMPLCSENGALIQSAGERVAAFASSIGNSEASSAFPK